MIEIIPLSKLALMLIPISLVFIIQITWRMPKPYDALYATARMLIQLLLVAYVLKTIFNNESAIISIAVVLFMLVVATWISIRPLRQKSRYYFLAALIGIFLSTLINLIFIFIIINPDPWYKPMLWIPIAGMIFSAAMNSVSLAAERFESVYEKTKDYQQSRTEGYNAALIPQINATLAVGLVALPGMMTGQILSGVEPLIAVRYQIMIMCMALSVAGIAAALYLWMIKAK